MDIASLTIVYLNSQIALKSCVNFLRTSRYVDQQCLTNVHISCVLSLEQFDKHGD